MSNAYLTGTSFAGVVVATVEEVLEEIVDFATQNNWAIESGSPSSLPLVLRCEFSVGGIKPFYRFSSPSAGVVAIQMDLDGTGTQLTSNTTNQFTSIGVGSRIWGASYQDRFLVFYVKPVSADGKAIGFGWPQERFDPLHAYSWILWNFDTVSTTAGTANKRVARQYNTSTNFSVCNGTASALSTFVAQNVLTGSATAFNVSAAGSKPILTPIPVLDNGNNPHGFVPLLVNGLCGASASAISTDPDTGIKYICTGASNHAFQISDPS